MYVIIFYYLLPLLFNVLCFLYYLALPLFILLFFSFCYLDSCLGFFFVC